MMHITDFHDTPSIAARYAVEDWLRAATNEMILMEAQSGRRHRRAFVADFGHLLVRLGHWLQAIAKQPTTMEETVQW